MEHEKVDKVSNPRAHPLNNHSLTNQPRSLKQEKPPRKDIWLVGLFPMKGHWPGGLGQLPAVKLGLREVNKHPHILNEYRLRMTEDDTEVSGGRALKAG